MRILVESLKRLYNSGKVLKKDIEIRVVSGRITKDEYEYITKEKYEVQDL